MRTGTGSGGGKLGHATCPACLASHAPLAAASFAGAVLGWRRRGAFYLHAVSFQPWLLALQRGGREKSSLINPLTVWTTSRTWEQGSTPYPAISGFSSLLLLKNVVLGEINPSASRAALRRSAENSHLSITLKYRLNLSIDCELFMIYSHQHLPQGEPGSVGPTRNLFHDPTRSASDIRISLRW